MVCLFVFLQHSCKHRAKCIVLYNSMGSAFLVNHLRPLSWCSACKIVLNVGDSGFVSIVVFLKFRQSTVCDMHMFPFILVKHINHNSRLILDSFEVNWSRDLVRDDQ